MYVLTIETQPIFTIRLILITRFRRRCRFYITFAFLTRKRPGLSAGSTMLLVEHTYSTYCALTQKWRVSCFSSHRFADSIRSIWSYRDAYNSASSRYNMLPGQLQPILPGHHHGEAPDLRSQRSIATHPSRASSSLAYTVYAWWAALLCTTIAASSCRPLSSLTHGTRAVVPT